MFKFQYLRFVLVAFLAVSFLACKRNKDAQPKGKYENGLLIINEGNFSASNGEVSFLKKADNSLTNNIFEIENGRPLACIIQDAEVYNNRIYLVGNRADKVEIVEAGSFKSVGSITTNLVNPISFAAVGNKGYIMNWGPFDNNFNNPNPFVLVFDLTNFNVLKTIPLSARPQGCIAYNNKVYIALAASNKIAILNPSTDTIEGDIIVANSPNQLVIDKNNKIWAICSSGALVRFNPANNGVEATITGVQTSGFSEKFAINPAKDELYWLAAEPFPSRLVRAYKMSITATSAPSSPIVTRNNLYGIGVSADNKLLLGDSKAFQGAGALLRFDLNGNLIDEFTTGIAPSQFLNR
ncbi:MAG: hypothetical protein NZ551_04105 [Microscillaceae bacterium]|nr:hypothetical protein [Microscillaceae bacterium]MDW8460374.1 hypothetical protein [Cytophagales bacterium]